ncbi:MAG: VIT1/CCC1 transporter family protein [Ilumatobacteraceae bacterium]
MTKAQRAEHQDHPDHRALAGGGARAGVFGVSDGLVTNVSLIIGFAAGGVDASYVRLAGIASAVAGAVSMAAGEWVSVKSQNDLVKREMALELRELKRNASAETSELAGIYRSHGMSSMQAESAAAEVMKNPERAVMVHAREEFGLDPAQLPNPLVVAAVSIVSFLLGAMLPVIPWLSGSGDSAQVASIAIGVVAAGILGAVIARQSERPWWLGTVRQVAITVLAVIVTYVIGSLVGVNVA